MNPPLPALKRPGFRALGALLDWPATHRQFGRTSMAISKLTRRTLLAGLAAAPLVRSARAAEWPARPVRVIVPYPPAGGADTTARILFNTVSQQFIVENRGGAGGTIGEAVIAKAEPDGYTILHDATGFSVNGSLYSKLSFDYRTDFAPVF